MNKVSKFIYAHNYIFFVLFSSIAVLALILLLVNVELKCYIMPFTFVFTFYTIKLLYLNLIEEQYD